ncbi:hypothetical protein CKK33_13090 [Mucilaginibacter sp. MD40]|uniref:hypothetical protein n=1 Tax=Mucilaginibacter sp. MD40 TaxID=2029590 RepID=UPI000BAC7755|nr:hypothetical protein [Mucilaginibacter sp. MD40]PAW94375.1 hypothetical protein CKK33_13090 [Mucilaginibacter sp. MD40]
MKAFTLPYSNSVPFYKERFTITNSKPAQNLNNKRINIGNYVIGVIGEGLKQNFLGADINMEFLTLTVRSYAIASAKTIRNLVHKVK